MCCAVYTAAAVAINALPHFPCWPADQWEASTGPSARPMGAPGRSYVKCCAIVKISTPILRGLHLGLMAVLG
jgi:hypothetical protein